MLFFFFKQKTAYEMRISDWSSDVCSSDLDFQPRNQGRHYPIRRHSNALHHAHDPCSFSPRSFEDDASTTGGGAAVRAAGGEAGSAAKRRRRTRFCWPDANKSARAARSIPKTGRENVGTPGTNEPMVYRCLLAQQQN